MFIAAWEFTHKAAIDIKKGNIVGCVKKFSLSIKESGVITNGASAKCSNPPDSLIALVARKGD
jgi:hypothetical protein